MKKIIISSLVLVGMLFISNPLFALEGFKVTAIVENVYNNRFPLKPPVKMIIYLIAENQTDEDVYMWRKDNTIHADFLNLNGECMNLGNFRDLKWKIYSFPSPDDELYLFIEPNSTVVLANTTILNDGKMELEPGILEIQVHHIGFRNDVDEKYLLQVPALVPRTRLEI